MSSECTPTVQQSAAASSKAAPPEAAPPKAAPPPPKEEMKQEGEKELPETGGTGSASLLGLGAGALLIGGGLLARRIVRNSGN